MANKANFDTTLYQLRSEAKEAAQEFTKTHAGRVAYPVKVTNPHYTAKHAWAIRVDGFRLLEDGDQ